MKIGPTRLCSGTQTADLYCAMLSSPESASCAADGRIEEGFKLSFDEQNQAGAIDEQLLPYLRANTEVEAHEHLNRLLETARPIVYRIARSMRESHVGRQFQTQDIFGDVSVRLLQTLQTFKNDPANHPIANYSGLVATITSTVFADMLRGQDRRRRSLYQKISRLIAANPALATWKDHHGDLVCGYAAWRTAKDATGYPVQMRLNFPSADHKRNTGELMLMVLNNAGHPIKFDEFVDLVNIASAGVEVQTVSIDDKHYVQSSALRTVQPDVIAVMENQRLLSRLFAEIQGLRVEQRKSLLLNMSDSYGYGIEWFLFTQIATEEHLATLLEVSIEQFRRLLHELPMTDAQIAQELGISQTKVMNMRRAVRERLERRRREFFGERTNAMEQK
jgi:RNA polymerase sigma factor (sigma-70 family)